MMGFGEAISTGWSKWNDFQGRARRSEYWFWQLFIWLVILVLVVLGATIDSTSSNAGAIAFILVGVFFLAIFIPTLAVQVRRLHDGGFSGWLILLNFLPYVGGLIVFVLLVLPSTDGDNKYGPDWREKPEQAF